MHVVIHHGYVDTILYIGIDSGIDEHIAFIPHHICQLCIDYTFVYNRHIKHDIHIKHIMLSNICVYIMPHWQ